jgi:solute carrier family 15 oligopeptide transporter 1
LIFSFNSILFPFLAKFGIRRPLQKLIFSYSMAVVAFLLAAIVQYKIFVSLILLFFIILISIY